nr:hypothetical protein [Tanacetum cinerariifolium]
MEYLVKISKKARILELKQRHLRITVLTSNTSYPSRKIHRIYACTSQKTRKETRSPRRVTTRGGKTTTQDVPNNNADLHIEEHLVVNHDKPDESNEVLINDQHQKTNEPVAQPSTEKQTSLVPFPRRLRKQKEEAQQKKFLENLKQLHINLPFIEALAQMPEYAKFLKDQSIKRPPGEEDECYGVDDLDDTINAEV